MGRWSNLTALQKATIIQMAADNGNTDLNEIINLYNEAAKTPVSVYNSGVMLPEITVTPNRTQRFRNGGKLVHLHEGKTSDSNLHTVENSIPTVRDFITQKLDSIRNDALDRARNTTETVDVKIYDPYAKEHREARLNNLQHYAQNKVDNYPDYTQYYNNMYNFYNGNVQMASEALHRYLLETDKRYAEEYGEYEEAIKNGDYRSAENCIGNLSRFYPHGLPTGNQTFAANPAKYGFKKIETENIQPGDLVQTLSSYHGTPVHAMMYNGKIDGVPTFNYSNGDSPVYDDERGIWYGGWGANKYFTDALNEEDDELNPNFTNIYTYVGTPQDSVQWVNEWMQKYGQPLVPQTADTIKALGGKIHIAPSKRGTFTAAATKHGKSVQEFAKQVLANKENYSPTMVRKAVFARNASHWHAPDESDSQSSYLNTQGSVNPAVINPFGFWDTVQQNQNPLSLQAVQNRAAIQKMVKRGEAELQEKRKAREEEAEEYWARRAMGMVEENPGLENAFTPEDIPFAGDALQGVEAAHALVNGDYQTAALLGMGFLMPNALEKILGKVVERSAKFAGRKGLLTPNNESSINDINRLLSTDNGYTTLLRAIGDSERRSDLATYVGNSDFGGNVLYTMNRILRQPEHRNMFDFIARNGVTVNEKNADNFRKFLHPNASPSEKFSIQKLQEEFNTIYGKDADNLGFFHNFPVKMFDVSSSSIPFRGLPGMAMGNQKDIDLFFSLTDQLGDPLFERIGLASTPWINHTPFQNLQGPIIPWTSKHSKSANPSNPVEPNFNGLSVVGVSGGIKNTDYAAYALNDLLGTHSPLSPNLREHASTVLPTGFNYNAAGHPTMLLTDGNGIYYLSDADAYDFGPSYVTNWVDKNIPSWLVEPLSNFVPHNSTPLYIGMPQKVNDLPSTEMDKAVKAVMDSEWFKAIKSTGGPLYPFSFQKNPYWKTPVVRYDNGGELSHKYGLGDFLSKLFARTYNGDFNTAFANARLDGRKFFKWNGNRYNTQLRYEKYREEHPEEFVPEFAYTDAMDRIVREENQKLSKNGYIAELDAWQPHKSVEGGAETVAYGLKLDSHNQAVLDELEKNKNKKYPKGYISNDFALQQSAKLLKDEYESLAKKYWNSTFKDGSWDKLTPKIKSIILDYQYNVNGGIKTFPKLMKAIHDVDHEGIKANYKRYTGGKELGRNKGIIKELEGLFNGDYTVYLSNL